MPRLILLRADEAIKQGWLFPVLARRVTSLPR